MLMSRVEMFFSRCRRRNQSPWEGGHSRHGCFVGSPGDEGVKLIASSSPGCGLARERQRYQSLAYRNLTVDLPGLILGSIV